MIIEEKINCTKEIKRVLSNMDGIKKSDESLSKNKIK